MTTVLKPWGWEDVWAETEQYVGKFLHILPSKRLSLQYHTEKDETFMLVSGLAFYNDGYGTSQLQLNKPVRVKPNDLHRISAGPDGAVLVEVSTPEVGQTVRLDDDYGRETE
jgi:mannose-6-phosphate isomerase